MAKAGEVDKCLETADRESLERFTLIGKDQTAAATVCDWIGRNIDTAPADKLREALDCALRMRETRHRKAAD